MLEIGQSPDVAYYVEHNDLRISRHLLQPSAPCGSRQFWHTVDDMPHSILVLNTVFWRPFDAYTTDKTIPILRVESYKLDLLALVSLRLVHTSQEST